MAGGPNYQQGGYPQQPGGYQQQPQQGGYQQQPYQQQGGQQYPPQQYPPQYQQQPYGGHPQAGVTPGLVTAGFILAIIPCTSFLGIILSIIGLMEAKKRNAGEGLALAGIIVGICWQVLLGGFWLFGAAAQQM